MRKLGVILAILLGSILREGSGQNIRGQSPSSERKVGHCDGEPHGACQERKPPTSESTREEQQMLYQPRGRDASAGEYVETSEHERFSSRPRPLKLDGYADGVSGGESSQPTAEGLDLDGSRTFLVDASDSETSSYFGPDLDFFVPLSVTVSTGKNDYGSIIEGHLKVDNSIRFTLNVVLSTVTQSKSGPEVVFTVVGPGKVLSTKMRATPSGQTIESAISELLSSAKEVTVGGDGSYVTISSGDVKVKLVSSAPVEKGLFEPTDEVSSSSNQYIQILVDTMYAADLSEAAVAEMLGEGGKAIGWLIRSNTEDPSKLQLHVEGDIDPFSLDIEYRMENADATSVDDGVKVPVKFVPQDDSSPTSTDNKVQQQLLDFMSSVVSIIGASQGFITLVSDESSQQIPSLALIPTTDAPTDSDPPIALTRRRMQAIENQALYPYFPSYEANGSHIALFKDDETIPNFEITISPIDPVCYAVTMKNDNETVGSWTIHQTAPQSGIVGAVVLDDAEKNATDTVKDDATSKDSTENKLQGMIELAEVFQVFEGRAVLKSRDGSQIMLLSKDEMDSQIRRMLHEQASAEQHRSQDRSNSNPQNQHRHSQPQSQPKPQPKSSQSASTTREHSQNSVDNNAGGSFRGVKDNHEGRRSQQDQSNGSQHHSQHQQQTQTRSNPTYQIKGNGNRQVPSNIAQHSDSERRTHVGQYPY